MSLKGTVPMKIEKHNDHDEYGQPLLSSTYLSYCSIVKLVSESAKTVARGSQSASLGNAHEIVSDSILLANLTPPVSVGDRVTVKGVALRVDKMIFRSDVRGKEDHYQLECSIWA
jgi:hypothetical protein